MRILHLINHLEHSNGNVHVAVDLACAQAGAGHDVSIASEGGSYEALVARHGVRVVRSAHHLRRPHKSAFGIARLMGHLGRFRPEIIHAHMMSGALLGFAASRLSGSALVATVHNSFDPHAKVMNVADAVVTVSHADQRMLASRGFSQKRLSTVWNGPLGSPRYDGAETGGVVRGKIVASVSGLHGRKGVDTILEAFAMIRPEHPDWTLVVAGEGPDETLLKRRAEELRLGEAVRFIGKVRYPQPTMQSAQIFVMASVAEPFGIAAVEARAAGCAVIATRVGGVPEVLEFGRAGVLVDPGDPAQIAIALRRMIADPDHLADMQARAQANLDVFAARRMLLDYDKVYARALAQRHAGRTHRTATPIAAKASTEM